MKEQWKDITGYEGFYKVSNCGRVKSLKRATTYERILKQVSNTDGYFVVTLSKKGKIKSERINRLVAGEFITNTENKREVNHIDGDKKNNKLNNLKWSTRIENAQHASDNNLYKRGVDHTNTTLTEDQIVWIRRLRRKIDQRTLAKMFQVSQCSIGRIQRRVTWAHI